MVLLLGLLTGSGGGAQPPPAEIARAVQRGDDAEALALLSQLPKARSELPAMRYLRGRLLERLRKPAQALAAYPSEGSGLPARVASDLERRRTDLLLGLGHHDQVCPRFEKQLRDGKRSAALLAALAECELASKRAGKAVSRLRQAVKVSGRNARYRLKLADALVTAGRPTQAKQELHQLLVEYPARTRMISRRLLKLGGSTSLSTEERIERADRLRRTRKPEQALEELAEGKPPRPRKLLSRWLHVRGMALYALRTRYAEAAQVLARAARLRGEHADSDAFHAARALSRADEDRKAVAAFRRFARQHRKSKHVATALYLAAWLELRHGLRGGPRNMRRFIDGRHASKAPSLVQRGLFALGMNALDSKRYKQADEYFERYAATDEQTMVKARGLYWAARAAAAGGRLSEAHELYRQALSVEPLHYYALLAAGRLREAGVDPGPPFGAALAPPGSAVPPPGDPLPQDARFYASLGLPQDARDALRAQEKALKRAAPAGQGTRRLVTAYHALDDYARPRVLVLADHAPLLHAPLSDSSRWAWHAAYPRPFEAEVEPQCKKHQVDCALVYAIIRKESGFDPEVVSGANAIGLMQLLLKTARQLEPVTREQLFEPATNIALGVRYYAGLKRRFDGQELAAVAAYNAGGHRVQPWLAETAEPQHSTAFDLFVERIPIDQTRNYVRRVASYWARYRYLERPDAGWPLSLPLEVRASERRRR